MDIAQLQNEAIFQGRMEQFLENKKLVEPARRFMVELDNFIKLKMVLTDWFIVQIDRADPISQLGPILKPEKDHTYVSMKEYDYDSVFSL